MRPLSAQFFGNPGSIHAEGVNASKTLKSARTSVARFFSCQTDEVVFTGSGTLANNLALFGVVEYLQKHGRNYSDMHIVTTGIEHSSVLEVFRELERLGVLVSYIPVRSNGLVDLERVLSVLNDKTVLVSVGYVNGEIGVIQPIGKITNIIRKYNSEIKIHIDASQAPEYLSLPVNTLGVDLCTIDGQKMYGPKGVGALFVKQGTKLNPISFGGGQEKGLYSGTEAIPLIVGLSVACTEVVKNRAKEYARMKELQDYTFKYIGEKLPKAVINGSIDRRIPNNINISLSGVDTEFLVIQLDQKGIACATKSACDADKVHSHVVHEIDPENIDRAKSTLRFTFGRSTRKRHIRRTVKEICLAL